MPASRHSVFSEGTDTGILGGLIVALWFLVLDVLAGQPLQTPNILGQVLLFRDGSPDTSRLVFGAILMYTVVHFAAFALVGMGVVALVHLGIREPAWRYAMLPIFLAFEVMFYGMLQALMEGSHEMFPFWTVLIANTLAAVGMGYFLWNRHPDLRRSIRETPLGDAPMH